MDRKFYSFGQSQTKTKGLVTIIYGLVD